MPSPAPFYIYQSPESLVPGQNLKAFIHTIGIPFDMPATFSDIPKYRVALAASQVIDQDGPIPDAFQFHVLVRALGRDQTYPTPPRSLRFMPKARTAKREQGFLMAFFGQEKETHLDVALHSHLGLRVDLNPDYPDSTLMNLIIRKWAITQRQYEQAKDGAVVSEQSTVLSAFVKSLG